ncbi:MAG: hypothetical protein IPM32_18065 [Ignavibacteriae bacterium]|nr:hypothetical protein [Ignavibacteriota bacterium]
MNEEQNINSIENLDEEKPPIFSSWKKLYIIVLINLISLIILFFLFTKYFN